jgi:DNA-binding CsgD family transcriptional regulator
MGAYEPWRDVFQTVEAVLDGSLDTALVLLDQVRQAGALFNQSPLRERLYVQLALATGRVDAATARWQTLRSLPDMRSAAPYAASSLHLVRGDIAMEAGELRDAEEAAQQALALTTAELPLVAVDAVELLAVVLARRQRTDDAGRLLGATEAFRERTGYRLRFPLRCAQVDALRPELDALDLSNGAALSLADAVALAQGTRGKRGRPSFGWDSLTPTEARVVELVSEGCSNSEIAEKLFIGVATVKTHLVHVYEKLGLRSRTELAAAAARREPSC